MRIFRDNFSKWTTLFFVVMAAFAIVFAKERFQADGAHYLLHVVQSESFRIEHQRYILAFSQFLPWLGVQLGVPLNAIIVLNSLNPVMWWLLLFIFAARYLKDRHAAMGIILTQVLGVMYIQFTPMYEIWYGVPLVILLFSHLRNERYRKPQDILFFLFWLITALFAHPLLPIAIAFAFVYHAVEKRKVEWRVVLPAAALTVAWFVAKKLMLTDYEAGKMSLLGAGWNAAPHQWMEIKFYGKLASYLLTWYTIPAALLVWTKWFFWLRNMKGQMLVMLLFVTGHIVLINVTHEIDPEQSPYFERMYLPLIPMILIPFLFTVCRELEMRPGFILIALVGIIGWRVVRFCKTGHNYRARTLMTEQLIRTAQAGEGNKFILNPADVKSCFSWVDWSFPMEVLLRSSAEVPYKRVSIITEEDLAEDNNREKLDADEFLFRRWEIMKDDELNQQYFHLSTGEYKMLPPQCDRK